MNRLLGLHEQVAKAKSPVTQAPLEAEIAATDRQIDQLVYDLYGLTDEEIAVVEGTPAERT